MSRADEDDNMKKDPRLDIYKLNSKHSVHGVCRVYGLGYIRILTKYPT